VRSGSKVNLGRIDLPRARSFRIETCGLTAKNFKSIAGARWPGLERLEVLFGGSDEKAGGTTSLDQVTKFLRTEELPNLSWLGLKNAEFTDDLIVPLTTSPLLPRLKALDLSMGTLTDKGAEQLMAHKAAFAHLESLNLEENALSEASAKALAELRPGINVANQ